MRCRWTSSRRGRGRIFPREPPTIWRAAWKPRITWPRRRSHWSKRRMPTWPRQRTRRADARGPATGVLSVGQENLGHLRTAAIKHADIADTLHDFAGGLPGQIIERRIPCAALPDPRGHLDQFVIGKGAIQFLHDV